MWRATLATAVFAHQNSTSRILHFELIPAPVRLLVADLACSAFHKGLAMQAMSASERASAIVSEMFEGPGVE